MSTPKAKTLITGEQPLNEGPEDALGVGSGGPPLRGPGGPPRRPGGPPQRQHGLGGTGDEGGLSARDRSALKDLIILDLLHATGNDAFYTEIAAVALKGAPLTPQMVRHLMDEAPKYADKMSPEVNGLMEKIATMPAR